MSYGTRFGLYRGALLAAELVVYPSRFVASYFDAFGVAPRRTAVLPDGVPRSGHMVTSVGWNTPRKRGQLNLTFLGAVTRDSGIHVAIKALRLASLERVRLLVCGDTPDLEYVRALRQQAAEVSGLTLQFYGSYGLHELTSLLYDTDSVVIPSTVAETFSETAWEALARGIPVVTSRLGALPEAVAESENGFTFDVDCPAEMAAIFLRLTAEENLLLRLREGALHTKVLSPRENMLAMQAVYQQALADLKTPASLISG